MRHSVFFCMKDFWMSFSPQVKPQNEIWHRHTLGGTHQWCQIVFRSCRMMCLHLYCVFCHHLQFFIYFYHNVWQNTCDQQNDVWIFSEFYPKNVLLPSLLSCCLNRLLSNSPQPSFSPSLVSSAHSDPTVCRKYVKN